MIRKLSWRSGAVREGRLAPLSIGRGWWGMIGALGAVGAMAYLLPSFADGRHLRGGSLPGVADIQLSPNHADATSRASPHPSSSPTQTWQDLPLLALENSTEVAAVGEVRLLALQAAFERERNSAAAAQLQVVALQEQLAHLPEKQEEVLVLREQLADAEARAKRAAEPTRTEAEQKKHVDNALLRVAVLQEELASLSTEVLKAKTTAESEKARAASAFVQLEDVQHRLAALTALQSSRTEMESPLRSNDTQSDDAPPPNISGDPVPAERASNLPLPSKAKAASSDEQRQTSYGGEKGAATLPRHSTLNSETKSPTRPVNKTAPVPLRGAQLNALRLTRLRQEAKSQSVQSVGKPSRRASPSSQLLARDTGKLRNPGALSLPNALLPDSTLW